MSTVDDRIVSMKFDNGAFEAKIADTIKSLDKLKQSLDLASATKGMADVATAAKSVDFTPMSSGIEGISAKFIALSTVAITAITNITMHMLRSAQQMSSAFTITPILEGFREYETNIGSIQTILANTDRYGTTLDQVTASLDQLNEYSDKTIYNFGQMVSNIGLFTNAGIRIEDATSMIQGFSNVAAASGTNAQGAASAAYQLSQALSAGTIRLMDWRSLQNVGMGNKNMQQGLIELAGAMGTLSEHGTTATEIQANFNGSLEKNWLSADVMSNYLKIMAGDMDAAAMSALGLSDAQIESFTRQQGIAEDAATKIRTFTQLVGTIKESIGSGWSESIRTVVGNFTEATDLFTGINNAISGFIGRSSDARNEILNVWRLFGGREDLIQGFKDAFGALANVLLPIKNAFRDFFPASTGATLLTLTERFGEFTEKIRGLTYVYIPRITQIFRGLFAGIEIGWTIIKNVIGLVTGLIGDLGGVTGGPILEFLGSIADKVVDLNAILVEGGGIEAFFDRVAEFIRKPIQYLADLKDAVVDFFGGFSESEVVEDTVGRVSDRLGTLTTIIQGAVDAWGWFIDKLGQVREVVEEVWGHISTFFSEFGSRLRESFSGDDVDEVVDLVNVGLLGGILLALRRFLNNGITLDFGEGLLGGVRDAIDGLTGTLSAMQAELRATTLMKIAAAVGILTISIVALSLIDSGALTRSLTAIAVGFGQLMAAMAIMSSSSFGRGSARMVGLATTMTILAVAIGILSIAVTNFSQLSWEELARGLVGVTVALGILTAATRLIAADTDGLIRAGIAMSFMAIGIGLLSIAVRSFAAMEWEAMAQGLTGVAVALGVIVAAMNLMPSNMAVTGGDILLISAALWVLAQAVGAFADMSWSEMGQGLLGIAGGLTAIVLALRSMPTEQLAVSGGGLLLMAAGMFVMAQAVKVLSDIGLGDLAKGVGALVILLAALAIAMNVMNGTAAGAAALIIVAGALVILTAVIKELSQLSIGELAIALGAIAGVFIILGLAALALGSAIPILFGLGVALSVIGAGFALFGAGAALLAHAFEIIARAGTAGVDAMIEFVSALVAVLPRIIAAFVEGVMDSVADLLNAAPLLLEALGEILNMLLDIVAQQIPRVAAIIGSLITESLVLIRRHFPELLMVGLEIVMTLLRGIRDNISEITSSAIEIVTNFAGALMANMPTLVATAASLILSFIHELGLHMEELVAGGLNLLVSFLQGIANGAALIVQAVGTIITTIIGELGNQLVLIVDAGYNLLTSFLWGIANNIIQVADTVTMIIIQFIAAIGTNMIYITDAGFNVLTNFLLGLSDHIEDVTNLVGFIITRFIESVGENATRITTAGADALIDFITGIGDNVGRVTKAAVDVIVKFIEGIDDNSLRIINAAGDMIVDFLQGIADSIRDHSGEIRSAGLDIAGALIDGMTGGLASRAGDVVGSVRDIASDAIGGAMGVLGINSPSKVFYGIGQSIAEGMTMALDQDTTVQNSTQSLAKRSIDAFESTLSKVQFSMASMEEFNPTITPVLDLTKVQAGARGLQTMMDVGTITADVSIDRARTIATTAEQEKTPDAPVYSGPTEVTFEQNIYAPTALSTNDIYNNTKSQIALAKEELNI